MFRRIEIEKSDGVRSRPGNLSLFLTAMTRPLWLKIVLYNRYKVDMLIFGVARK